MSKETDSCTAQQDSALALFLLDNDGDELTDILVSALNDALRILEDEAQRGFLH